MLRARASVDAAATTVAVRSYEPGTFGVEAHVSVRSKRPSMDRRQFLLTAAAGAAFAAAPAALARAPLEGEASRKGADLVVLAWAPKSPPAAVSVSPDPDAAPGAMRLISPSASGGRADASTPVSPRPYFLVRTADGGQLRLAERLLPLQGGRNFRDLGGYRGAGGRQVRWGRLYRSGVMSGLTAADMTYLSDLGIRVICDLRSTEERTNRPNPFIARGAPPQVVATDYPMFAFEGLQKATTRAQAIDAFAEAYVEFTQALTPQYTDMFDRIVRGDVPLAVNCSAGKDRTGMASALILTVLGVPRETVVADFALTQVYAPIDLHKTSGAGVGLSPTQMQAFAKMPPEVIAVMGGSDPEIMRAALAKIDARFGGPIALVKSRYGMTDAKISDMRQRYLIA
jgi:protein-tyrosine phosphatase